MFAGAHADAVDRDRRAGGDALDLALFAVHRAADTLLVALTEQVDAGIAGAAPDHILRLRIDPHRFLREGVAGLADIAQHADGGARLAFELRVADSVSAVGEHHGEEQGAQHDRGDHEQDPGDDRPVEYDAEHNRDDNRRDEGACGQPRQLLILFVGELEQRDDILHHVLALAAIALFSLVCHLRSLSSGKRTHWAPLYQTVWKRRRLPAGSEIAVCGQLSAVGSGSRCCVRLNAYATAARPP